MNVSSESVKLNVLNSNSSLYVLVQMLQYYVAN